MALIAMAARDCLMTKWGGGQAVASFEDGKMSFFPWLLASGTRRGMENRSSNVGRGTRPDVYHRALDD
ncbi:hypothetical protein GJ744_009258 [Endocarpon pusillum]|uniref:Uncharacterized protein n=1 Tax=Endocarpon pusillum TaxID=364733 RepID=A0A8H7E4M2_9EURO|nr:hypothetical protein GJ744_009258 [Endocarpon pusillum]